MALVPSRPGRLCRARARLLWRRIPLVCGEEARSPARPTSCLPGAGAASSELGYPVQPRQRPSSPAAASPASLSPGGTPSRALVSTEGAEWLRAGRRALAGVQKPQRAPQVWTANGSRL